MSSQPETRQPSLVNVYTIYDQTLCLTDSASGSALDQYPNPYTQIASGLVLTTLLSLGKKIIIVYICYVLINALSSHVTHFLNTIFYARVKHSPTKTIYVKYYMEKKERKKSTINSNILTAYM